MNDHPGPRLGRDVDPSDPAGVAQSRGGALSRLRKALEQMSREGFSPARPVSDVVTDEIALLASAVAAPGGTYDVAVTVNCHPEPLGILDGVTLDLRPARGLHFLAVIDETGSASFSGVPSAEWRVLGLDPPARRLGGKDFAMPALEQPGALAASSPPEWTRQVHGPDGRTLFTVRTAPGETATLEISVSGAGDAPFLVPVTYEADRGQQVQLLAPIAPQRGKLYTALALPGLDPYRQWSAGGPVPPRLLGEWEEGIISASVSASRIYPRAARSWAQITALAPAAAAEVIRAAGD
jgi:hypothetical protein